MRKEGVACILSPYGAFTEKPPAMPVVVLLFQGYDSADLQNENRCDIILKYALKRDRKAEDYG